MDQPGQSTQAADRREHGLRPLVLDAALAHREGSIRYADSGEILFRPARAGADVEAAARRIPLERQFPVVRATFDDLNKALSRLANSPLLEGGTSLRALYDLEVARYDELAAACFEAGGFEPDYGSYIVDHRENNLYLVAPERWHRLALVTSNSQLLSDPEGRLSWREARNLLESAVVGFAGVSVGGNLFEGWLREARPARVKLADPDWIEATNFNRGERMSLRHLAGSRAQRFDPKNPYDVPRVSKAEYLAYEAQLVDPYAQVWVYKEGLTRGNLGRFLDGDGADEPAIDVLVEEMDNLDLKILSREEARARRIDVLMLSDFGHRAELMWNHFREQPSSPLGFGASDEQLRAAVAATKSGGRSSFFAAIDAMCGAGWADEAFAAFIEARGEQPTGSLPQSGATAMASGAIGGKELALHVLGHHRGQKSPVRASYDLRLRTVLRS